MELFEVKIYDHDNKLLRVNLIQAVTKEKAKHEALNTFNHTTGAHRFTLE